jgi:hypothetical protein
MLLPSLAQVLHVACARADKGRDLARPHQV